ncbi:Glutamyl-tRNA(Gln) amidotransferase subunit A [Labilithrix luteola]|uniref:Glutamyl-tRNA(Gln) amidotransferase subunit A n=2 Tax=Labilithrix luteola TaxID=1391654 RepID=A0A0K1Q6L1_9BACT|nr:Glutamyl-tRNA(Gln) amidotransferase subunit A [Labilithrix luteola]
MALAGAIRDREVTSREILEAHIGRISQVNPTINALVKDRFDAALQEARDADEKTGSVHRDDLPPFHGIPFTAKDALRCAGMPNTSGLWARRDLIADDDATAVKRLKNAGAILLGVSNISELCMWMESSNKVWGRTNNPYDPTRTAGGSSGGEGALVGSGGSIIGLGSDVGGSIRMPAFFNGVFGHKPTGGLVPSTGHYPPARNRQQRYVTTGPIARRAADLMPFLRVVAGPDGIEEHSIEPALGDPATIDLSRTTVYVVPGNGIFAVDPRMQAAQESAARVLEDAGARVERRQVPALKRSAEIWSAMLHDGGGSETFQDLMAAGGELKPLREIGKAALGRSRYTLPGLLLCLFERVPTLLGSERAGRIVQLGHQLRRELEAMLGDDGVMLFPSYPTPAPKHYAPMLVPFKWVYTAIFNVMEMPVTQVPMGLDERGVPLGVQVAARRQADTLTIAVALELERAVGGWTPPPRWPFARSSKRASRGASTPRR